MVTKSRTFRVVVWLALLALMMAACAQTPAPASPPNADSALRITGNVAQEVGWSEEEIKAMDTLDIESENSDGETETYTGVAFGDLLSIADPGDDATTLVLVADDGYSVEMALAEVEACAECIVSFRSQGGFTSRMPGFPKNTSVKGLVEIQVQ